MPSPSKRPQRTRREPTHKNEIVDSSPSRPAKRRKKIDNPSTDPATESEDSKPLPTSRKELPLDDEELIAAVIPHLAVPAFHVQATQDHANSLHEKHHKEGVQAYAKLAGKDWTFYVKQLKNLIGRPPEGTEAKKPYTDSKDVMQVDEEEDGRVQVDLGPNKVVSREHANIYFDSDSESWNIEVLGRNAIRLNNDSIKRGAKLKLISGQVIEIGGVEMMFVLPEQDGLLAVHNKFLARAKLIADDPDYNLPSAVPPATLPVETPVRSHGGFGIPGTLPIAPAPPNYQRPGTPVSAQSRTPYSSMKSPAYAGGTIFMNSENVDLAADENALIKPSFSYANLISQAILNEKDEKLNLNGIYTYIMSKYAYYRHQPAAGWQNSIRHNLSLNKAFLKVPRSTDEPGKGMKWTITPENRDEMIRGCAKGGRGGHRGSSIPNSPANFGDPRFMKNEGAPSSGPRRKRSPRSGSPGFPSTAPQLTPDRKTQLSRSLNETPGDGSPLPPLRRARPNYGITDILSGSPPSLSSSYLQEENNSFVTPAPHRVHPRLAPPSTAQRPSQVMPTSSPAPFWKYADIGNTPMKGSAFESSPIKGSARQIPPSSSPPPIRRSSAASPSRTAPVKSDIPSMDDIEEEEDKGFDLTMGFQSISSFHASVSNGIPMGKSNGVPGR